MKEEKHSKEILQKDYKKTGCAKGLLTDLAEVLLMVSARQIIQKIVYGYWFTKDLNKTMPLKNLLTNI
ncbi:hypothetical protein AGMMS49921_00410 [Endomicrobiia bacterium]|nr:hypothetical protein AGMMS49921_00410 [Endomicrobiia bacterium]